MVTDLDALDKLRAGATPGRWRTGGPGIIAGREYVVTGIRTDPDAALIVAAVTALPDLIAAARERDLLRADKARLKADLEASHERNTAARERDALREAVLGLAEQKVVVSVDHFREIIRATVTAVLGGES